MKNSIISSRKSFRNILIILIWLTIWEIVSLFVNNAILIVGPFDVVKTLAKKCFEISFYKSILYSFAKIALGFVTGTFAGVLLAVFSWKSNLVEDFVKPVISFLKAAPVASFVVLFLIWWHSNMLSVAIVICVVLPQIYISLLQGLNDTNSKLMELANVFGVSAVDRVHYIYRPAVRPHIESAMKIAAGMAWKSGVAAEVIGTPDNSIGNSLYMSKIHLDTAGVLAWTVVIILLSVICEKILFFCLNKYFNFEFKCNGINSQKNEKSDINKLSISKLKKSFNNKSVICDFNAEYLRENIYELNWPSGSGKTTLFRIIAGLEIAEEGTVFPNDFNISMVFQDERLIEDFSAIKNVELICGDRVKSKEILLGFLDEEHIYKNVKHLSGGQKRKVSVAMAISKQCDIGIFDEPFEGLDEENKKIVEKAINEYSKDKIVLIASHIH